MASKPVAITVEKTFFVRGTLIVVPDLPADSFPAGSRLSLEVRDAIGGVRIAAGSFEVEHLRLIGGGSRWHGLIVLDHRFADAVEPGNTLTATVEE
jgi:hypothetical protein